MMNRGQFETAEKVFRHHGGVLRMSEALKADIHRRMLYSMLEAGVVERLGRGLYRLADLQPLGNPDLVSVSLKIPNGVVCLISALAYKESIK
jgi:predicted transcriptional regulator of viral defense system